MRSSVFCFLLGERTEESRPVCDFPENEGKEEEEDKTRQGTDQLLAEAAECLLAHKMNGKYDVSLFPNRLKKKHVWIVFSLFLILYSRTTFVRQGWCSLFMTFLLSL